MSDPKKLSREQAEECIRLACEKNPELTTLFDSGQTREQAIQNLMEGGSLPQQKQSNTEQQASKEKPKQKKAAVGFFYVTKKSIPDNVK